MLRVNTEPTNGQPDPHRIYGLSATASMLNLSIWHCRHLAVVERRIAFIRHSPKGKLGFLGMDIISYLNSCRQPAVGERGRRAAQAAAVSATDQPSPPR